MNSRNWFGRSCQLGLSGLVILVGLIGGEGSNLTFAQVTPDPSLGTKVTIKGNTLEITGGTTVGDKNLFHSFSNFSVNSNEVVNFLNAATINNIFVRVTGGNLSKILGMLQAQGNANLFLINPNGITFSGPDAGLSIKGSFIGTTASAIQFPGGGEFSMTSQVNSLNPLLTVNPSAFLFNQIASRPISRIQVNKAFLQVHDGQSLLLLGGDVNLERGKLLAVGGRVELGGLAEAGTVGLNFDINDDSNNLRLSFPQGVQRADVSLNNASRVSASSKGGGGIQVQGRRVTLTNESEIAVNTLGSEPGGTLVVNASELVELGASRLLTDTAGSGSGGELRIETPHLILKDGAQASATTSSEGQGGRLSVTADSIQLMGTDAAGRPSGLFAKTQGTGNAGDLKIETGKLIVRDGAQVSSATDKNSQGRAGTLSVTARDSIQLIGTKGESRSGLFVGTEAPEPAGNLDIKTGQLIVQDGARISAATTSGEGGNINMQVGDLISMRGASEISASASNNANGGNITINAKNGFIVAVPSEYSNIIAKADEGRGGNIKITSSGIYGFVFHPDSFLSNINASSKAGPQLNGTVEINTPDVDPSRGLVNLPITPVDTKVSQVCQPSVGKNQSSFIITGRGGLPPNPREPLSGDAVQVDWVTLNPKTENRSRPSGIKNPTPATPAQIVQATGWTRNAKGEVVLTADAPTATSHSSWQTPANCGTAESIK